MPTLIKYSYKNNFLVKYLNITYCLRITKPVKSKSHFSWKPTDKLVKSMKNSFFATIHMFIFPEKSVILWNHCGPSVFMKTGWFITGFVIPDYITWLTIFQWIYLCCWICKLTIRVKWSFVKFSVSSIQDNQYFNNLNIY